VSWRPQRVGLGAVGRPHGIAGSFRVEGAVDWFAFEPGATVLIAGVPRRIVARRGEPGRPILTLAGVADRDAVAALRGQALEVAAADAPEPEQDAFWVFDLVGCRVICGGLDVGRVREVLDLPANDVLVVEKDDGSELLLPFVHDAIPVVDVGARRLELREGFLD
jgi:16S rRNA processing protein RimM